MVIDIFPSKAQYLKNEPIEIIAEIYENHFENCMMILNITNMEKTVYCEKRKITQERILFSIPGFNDDFAGYGVDAFIIKNGEKICRASTAFDVVSSPAKNIRYGFLSDFSKEGKDNDDVETLRKYHINMVQYYDWSYRHDNFISYNKDYTDMMGRKLNIDIIKEKIKNCHKYGIKSIAYGPIYAASKEFYENHSEWGFYSSSGKPLVFINVFYIMNISKECPWHEHIINEYVKALKEMGFDGIHMDTYGFPKTAFSKYGGKKTLVKLEEEIPQLIDDAKIALNEISDSNYLIFNNVGNWPVDAVANSKQAAIYVEVWDPYNSYLDLKQIILNAQKACMGEKQIILAAYLEPFKTDSSERAFNAARLLSAAVFSNGGINLLLGEKNAVLTGGYYVDHSFLSDGQVEIMRRYYDFAVRYMQILFEPSMKDVSFTHIGWDNMEYKCLNKKWSVNAQSDALWLVIKENENCKCINIINLCGCDNIWNKGKDAPEKQEEVWFRVQLEVQIEGIYFASPDGDCISQKLPYSFGESEQGIYAEFCVPEIYYWGMIYIRLRPDEFMF